MTAGRIPQHGCRRLALRLALCLALASFLGHSTVRRHPAVPAGPKNETKRLAALKMIYAEVKEMGPYPGDDFIRREFFVGEDDDDTNKDVQVVVLIQSFELQDKMTIRVTEMAREPAHSRTSVAKSSKALVCLVDGDVVEILSSDYQKDALDRLVPEILTAIRNKKRLLKLETPYQFPYFFVFSRWENWEIDMVSRINPSCSERPGSPCWPEPRE